MSQNDRGVKTWNASSELRTDDTTQSTAQLIIQHCTVLLIAGIPIASETHGRLRARTYASAPYKMEFIPFLSKKN